MNLGQFNQFGTYLTIAAAAGLLARLLWSGMARSYAFLFAYFLADILQSALSMGVSPRAVQYGYIYFGGQAAKILLAVGVSIQLWVLALRAYRGLARVGRRIAICLVALALAAGALLLLLEPPRQAAQSVFTHSFNAFEGAVDSATGIFLVGATLFLLWFPVEVPRNVARITGGFVLYLALSWAGLLLLNLYPQSVGRISAVFWVAEALVLMYWIRAIRSAGERVTTVTGHRWNAAEAERLLGELGAINARLERIGR